MAGLPKPALPNHSVPLFPHFPPRRFSKSSSEASSETLPEASLEATIQAWFQALVHSLIHRSLKPLRHRFAHRSAQLPVQTSTLTSTCSLVQASTQLSRESSFQPSKASSKDKVEMTNAGQELRTPTSPQSHKDTKTMVNPELWSAGAQLPLFRPGRTDPKKRQPRCRTPQSFAHNLWNLWIALRGRHRRNPRMSVPPWSLTPRPSPPTRISHSLAAWPALALRLIPPLVPPQPLAPRP